MCSEGVRKGGPNRRRDRGKWQWQMGCVRKADLVAIRARGGVL